MLSIIGIALIILGIVLFYLGRLTPAQRREHVPWAPVVLCGTAAALVFASETPSGAPGLLTRTGFTLFMVFAGLTAGFGWFARRYAGRKPSDSNEPDPDTPMDTPWGGQRAA